MKNDKNKNVGQIIVAENVNSLVLKIGKKYIPLWGHYDRFKRTTLSRHTRPVVKLKLLNLDANPSKEYVIEAYHDFQFLWEKGKLVLPDEYIYNIP